MMRGSVPTFAGCLVRVLGGVSERVLGGETARVLARCSNLASTFII